MPILPPPAPTGPGATASLPVGVPPLEDAYREHSASVLGLARRLLGDPSLAEEVTQEVFLRLWRRPERFDADRGSLRSFLLAECHGRSVDVCDTLVHHRVADLVQALPDTEREAISLAYCEHLTYREVATVLGAPVGTVKGRIRSGLRRLRAEMALAGIDGA